MIRELSLVLGIRAGEVVNLKGISQKGHQIACAITIYFNEVMCKLAWPLRAREHETIVPMRMSV